jgi:hypothetical protein
LFVVNTDGGACTPPIILTDRQRDTCFNTAFTATRNRSNEHRWLFIISEVFIHNCLYSHSLIMAALPSDLRAVMQPMTIYTDNTGGGSDNASYVTKTTDYLPLLAEYEIFGTRTYANSAEKNYQAQYAYYSAGNSKVKYRHSATSSLAWWWERSPYYSGSSSFCIVYANGSANFNYAGYSNGVAPAFRV